MKSVNMVHINFLIYDCKVQVGELKNNEEEKKMSFRTTPWNDTPPKNALSRMVRAYFSQRGGINYSNETKETQDVPVQPKVGEY